VLQATVLTAQGRSINASYGLPGNIYTWRIRRKVVRLINSADTLSTVGYVL
jgi:hypothetical protein